MNKNDLSYLNKIVLSTIHKSKGLEWKYVFLLNINDEFFPGDYNAID